MPPASELANLSRPRLYRVSRARTAVSRARRATGAPGGVGVGRARYRQELAGGELARSAAARLDLVSHRPGRRRPGSPSSATSASPRRGTAATARPLPRYAEEYRRDHAGFTRRWFRELFARLPPGGVLVFDDFHDARTGHDERAAFAAGLEEIPAGFTVVATSRGDPPRSSRASSRAGRSGVWAPTRCGSRARRPARCSARRAKPTSASSTGYGSASTAGRPG